MGVMNEQMVSVPREWLAAYLGDDNAKVYVDGERTSLWELLSNPVAQPVEQHQDEPVEWTTIKPTSPGAYWVRGNGLEREALIEVINDEGELRCNLHQRTTETDFGYGYSIEQLSVDFEWYGPLVEKLNEVKGE